MKRVAIYARISTDDQTTEDQLRDLREVAARNGWEVVQEYVDKGTQYYEQRLREQQLQLLKKKAASLGLRLIEAEEVA